MQNEKGTKANNMINTNIKKIFITCLSLLIILPAFSAPPKLGKKELEQGASILESSEFNIKKQLTYITMAGLGGAVLGLSTLSFSSKPHRHLRNIAIAAAVAVIAATIYVTYATTWTENPATGDDLILDKRKVVTFNCSSVLRDKLNN